VPGQPGPRHPGQLRTEVSRRAAQVDGSRRRPWSTPSASSRARAVSVWPASGSNRASSSSDSDRW